MTFIFLENGQRIGYIAALATFNGDIAQIQTVDGRKFEKNMKNLVAVQWQM